jgi:[glutamine synthetase] adenylyltransferase / [glutamine synthetase]-adenylyl-L-tyrosine phosphorylase
MSFDKHITPSAEQLSHLGVQDTGQALRNLELLRAKLGPAGFSEIVPLLLADLSRAADPDMALNNFERFVSALTDSSSFASLCRERPDIRRALITICGASRFLSAFLVTIADESLIYLLDPLVLSHPADERQLAERLAFLIGDRSDDHEFFRRLRLFRKKEMLRIGLRDLLDRADLRETVVDLSQLAEVCLQKAYEWADAGLAKRYGRPIMENPDGSKMPAGFAVIAMGKLGGGELNFSSDVDLMYVYTADGETEGILSADGTRTNRITNHQYFIKLAEKLSAAINEKTEDGFVFRVDMRLRPEGQRGPLAQSLGGYEIYYESWGQTWERSALLKARPVAGDEALGREFMDRIKPFVYRKYLDFGAIAEIRDMKQKINRDVEQKGRIYRDVKLGYGGIREIEFVIQALQLIYSGKDRTLREKNALRALHVLSQKGLISYQEHSDLSKAYIFLRTVEHRIQILDDIQSQTLPSDEGELRSLARRTGYFEHDRETEALLRDYADHTKKVRGIYDDLFAFTVEEGAAGSSLKDYSDLLDPETPEREAVSLLGKLGLRDPGKAYRDLLLLREGAAFVHQTPRSRKLFNEIFPALFREIISSPDPDMALNHLESFLAAQGSWEAFQTLMRIDPAAGKVLIAVFANSEYLSRMLVSRPILLQSLIESRKSSEAGTRARFATDLADILEHAPDIIEKLDTLRRFKHLEEIRIGMADLLSNMPLATVSRELSKLAEVCLDAALRLAASETGKRYQTQGSTAGIAVIGAGKLGGRELSYGSDLDILFVFSEPHAAAPPPGLTVFEYFSKVAEKTISYLSTLTREGFVFRVDTRLRPTGTKGPLVQSMDEFKRYVAGQAETWEHQALLRARPVAGDRAFGAAFCRAIQDLIYREADKAVLARDIVMMRRRMEEEIGKESATHYNIKQGAGGLVDIEFITQYLQLCHGRQHRRVRVPGAYNALRSLRKERLLEEDDYHILMRAYLFIRLLESRMRIVSNQVTSDLSRDPIKLQLLARRMGYTDEAAPAGAAGRKLLADYEQLSAKVREVFERILQTAAV